MMTRKERFERALRRQEVDRLPFWVKIFGASHRSFEEEPYRSMGELELADCLDLDHMAGGPSPVVCTNERVERHTEQRDGLRVTRIETPDGTLTAADRFDPGSHSWHPAEFPIKSPADLKAARHAYVGNRFATGDEPLARARERVREVGDRGIVMAGMGISPLMDLIQHQIGPVNTYYFLTDYPAETDELIALMHEERMRFLRCLLADCPYDYVMSVENTSTTLLSPTVFERYCWRHLADYGRLITGGGKAHLLHMCGHLRALLPRIGELPALAVEAYTTPPVGNATLADRAALCPATAVIGGTNATLWLRPADEICEAIEAALAEAGGARGVVLTSAGEMPRLASIDKIRQVRERLRALPVC